MEGIWSVLRRRPLERRVSFLTALAVAAIMILSCFFGYLILSLTIYHASQQVALSVATDLVGPATEDLQSTGGLTERVQQAGGVVVEVLKPDGTVIRIPSDPLQLVLQPGDQAAAGPSGQTVRRTGETSSGASYTIVAVPLTATGDALVVGRPLGPAQEILRVVRLIIAGIIVASIVAAAVGGLFVARAGLRPVRLLTRAVEHVSETKDFQPIAIRESSGDLATLAAAFNGLLRSVSQMRERQSRLVADAGHELRTPLTSLTMNVDLLISDQDTGALSGSQKAAILGDVRAQLGELNALIGDLVHLSRDDSAGAFQPLDVRDVVHAAVERVRRRAKDRVFHVQLDELYMVGDPDSLERAVTNLLDNAVKWSPTGSTIRVSLEGNRLRVADSGPGIPEQDLPYVFDRFFRGETARKTHGTGLGLSIVAKAVEDHGGTVEAGRSDDGGAQFTIRLPGVTSREALPQLLVPTG